MNEEKKISSLKRFRLNKELKKVLMSWPFEYTWLDSERYEKLLDEISENELTDKDVIKKEDL